MFFLAPLGDLTRFLSSNIKIEVYLITEDVCIKSNGLLLAARSAKIEEILEESENIPAVQFSDNMAGLEDCLDLVYGRSVDIREDNFKSIYKFGKLFEITKMMKGVLAWIANDVTYENFWSVYLDLKSLDDNISDFVNIITGYLSAADDNFMELTTELCRSQDKNTITAVVELMSRIDDIRVLSVMENIINTATENNETLAATTSSTNTNHYLQTVASSTVTYIENYLKTNNCNEFRKARCKQTLQKVSSVCTHVETLRKINRIFADTSIQLSSCWNFTATSIKDLNWERVEKLISPTTSYHAIKYFTENAGTRIHPCVVVEIVLKWWRVRTNREHADISFITPFITTIQNVSSFWYKYSVCKDGRYKGLTKTLDTPKLTAIGSMCYTTFMGRADAADASNERNLRDCISKGDGTPVQLEDLECTRNMERYRQGVPAFRYNAAVFPPYGDTKHHWYIETSHKHVSLITNSKQEILNDINNTSAFTLHFVPLPETLQ